MNILREVRRVNQKSMPIRIISILLFSVILIVSTFAWFSSQKDVDLGGLTGDVTSWDVSYYVRNEERLDQTATFTINQLYPGMDLYQDRVHIYNIGTSSTNIEYKLISVKVFGETLYEDGAADNELTVEFDEDTNTTYIFTGDTQYPFEISYTYDKDYLNGKYDMDTQTPVSAHAILELNVDWEYGEEGSVDGEISDKDALDTQFGKDAYEYYQNELNDPSKAIEIKVKITSNFIHPSLEVEWYQGFKM